MTGARAFVEQLYQLILRRAPDEAGWRDNVAALEGYDDPLVGATELVAAFRHSPEARRLHRLVEATSDVRFQRCLTLGTHCFAAAALRSAERRHASYPFDWIFSSASMVAHCLETDFADFLDPRYFFEVPGNPKVGHGLYWDRFEVGDVFAHRDPRQPDQAAYYRRCIDRFRWLAGTSEPCLIVMIANRPDEDAATFPRLARWFDHHFPAATFMMLSILEPNGGGVTSIRFAHGITIGRHRHALYQATSRLGGLSFASPLDDMMIRAFLVEQPVAD